MDWNELGDVIVYVAVVTILGTICAMAVWAWLDDIAGDL